MALTVVGLLLLLVVLAIGLLGPLWRPCCPGCKAPADRVISWGLPVWFCLEHPEPIAFGLFSWPLAFLPFDGMLFVVRGPYLIGVWQWLLHVHDPE